VDDFTMTDPAAITGMAAAMERIVEGAPIIVIVMGLIGIFIWRAWRDDTNKAREERQQFLVELREERQSRALAHAEMVGVAARSNDAINAVREALAELRHAIRDRA
jgi:hypothetical protein